MEGKNLNEEIDLREILLKLWKYKVFILIFTVFALIASALAANMIKPKYNSQASVVPNLMEFKKIEISRPKDMGAGKKAVGEGAEGCGWHRTYQMGHPW